MRTQVTNKINIKYFIKHYFYFLEKNQSAFLMKKIGQFFFVFILSQLVFVYATFPQTSIQSATASQRKLSQKVKLFNGKNLEGWYKFLQKSGRDNDPEKVFSVVNGWIRIGGEEWGCITTNKEYENYRLILEFKWGGKTFAPRTNNARDCGILLHSKGPDGGSQGIWMRSIECQIIEGGTGDFIVVGDSSDAFQLTTTIAKEKTDDSYVYLPGGDTMKMTSDRINWYARDAAWKDTIGFRGTHDIEKPTGEWNRMECIADKGELTVILNGTVVNHAFNVEPRKGRIQIQAEGAEIFFKKVELLPLR